MKKVFFFLALIFACFNVSATDYFIAATGNDANSGTSEGAPWKSINKLNAYFSNLRPGDRVLFRRGDTFYGSIIVNKSGTAGAPITLGAYGSGEKPVITGFTTVNSWRNVGGNIWESTNAVSSLPYTNMVVVDGVNTAMGRYPNEGYLTYQNYSGKSSITSSDLNSSTNWTGAELVLFMATFYIGRNPITNHSGNTIYYRAGASDASIQYNNQSFFIQNDIRTLDAQNEWYYNSSTRKMNIFSLGYPSNVKLTTIDTLLLTNEKNYVVIDGLRFEGSNKSSILINNSKYITITNCSVQFAGGDAITGPYYGNSTGLTVENSDIQNVNNTAIALVSEFDNATIRGNIIKNIGMIAGMGGTGSIGNYFAIHSSAPNTRVEENIIENVGYIGVSFHGSNTIIKNNVINKFCEVLHDGGGIYTWNSWPNTTQTGIKVLNNIVINGPTNTGIYMDDNSNGIEVSGNTVANCFNGIYIHNTWNMKVNNNTSYNNGYSSFNIRNDNSAVFMSNIELQNNVFFAKSLEQRTAYFYLLEKLTDVNSSGNYYAKPINNSRSIDTYYNGVYGYKPLSMIQSITGKETNSKESPKGISDENELRFEYNPTKSNRTIGLDASYIDVMGNSYNGSVTLAPFSSVVLIRNGEYTNQRPVADAGADREIILPKNSVSLVGGGSDQDGYIIAYNWSKFEGGTAIIENPDAANTSISGLAEGLYAFILKVTDNNGAYATDTIRVTVSAAVSLLPAVDPGLVTNGLEYQYFEAPSFETVPDFSSLSAKKTGSVTTFSTEVANRSEVFAIKFDGYIYIPSDGEYNFYTNSDDGSLLYIDNILVVNNDGLHGAIESSGVIGLKAGYHSISVGYFQQNGNKSLDVYYSGNGITKQVIPSTVLFRSTSDENLLPAQYPSSTVNGLDYLYFEGGKYEFLPNFDQLSPTKRGSVNNFSIDLANRNEVFAFKYSGYIDIPVDGNYTFYTLSDDGSNLFIDGRLVVDNDGLHYNREMSGSIGLKAGKHYITVGYFQQNGGKILNVSFEGPGFSKRLIEDRELYRVVEKDNFLPSVDVSNLVNGIYYKYYEGGNYYLLPDFSALLPIKTGIVPSFEISPASRSEVFSFDFTGYIDIPFDGNFTFYTLSDDGSKLYIDDKLVVDNDGLHYNREMSGSIGLKAGKHAIRVSYFQQLGNKILNVSYSGPGVSKQTIPSSILYSSSNSYFSQPLASRNSIINGNFGSGNISAFPNPFINSLKVTLDESAGHYEIEVVDLLGRVLMNRSGEKNQGYYQQTLNLTSLQKGLYIIRVKQNDLMSTIKVQKN